ncbi:MAG: chemotaxis protein CheC [Bacillota bacterium]
MKDLESLSSLQLDVLREIGNIGAGNAATALAQMLNRKIEMSVPQVRIMQLEEILNLVGNEEDPVACINLAVFGSAPVRVLFLLPAGSAYMLIDLLLGQNFGATTTLGALEESVLCEAGNILTGSFLNAFAMMTQINFISSVPYLAFDMLGAVISSALVEGGCYSDQVLLIETNFANEQGKINSHFFILPEESSLEIILKAVGINCEEGVN